MQPSASQHESDADCDLEPDVPNEIPEFIQKWASAPQVVSAVRRPAKLPDPQSYHEAIEPQAIFELDEKQEDGSTETILVVPFPCTGCKIRRKACSRARPTCALCRKALDDSDCRVFREDYQRLPPPKFKKRSVATKCSATSSRTHEGESTPRGLRLGEAASITAPLTIASGQKRTRSPGPDPEPPRKKTLAKSTSGSGKRARRHTVSACQDMDVDTEQHLEALSITAVETVESVVERSALKWTFVNNGRRRDKASSGGQEHVYSNARVPRVWTNSLNGLLTVFPELAKAPVGFSWFQSDIPVLLLDTNYAEGCWINSTTLAFDLQWDFSCYDSELEPEPVAESGMEASTHTQPHSSEPVAPFPENALDCDVDMMVESFSDGQQYSPLKSNTWPTHMGVSTPPATFSMLPLDSAPQDDRGIFRGTYEAHIEGSVHGAPQDVTMSPTLEYPSSPLTPVEDSPPRNAPFVLDELILDRTISQVATPSSRVPFNKPPEVETLLGCHVNFIPLLLWLPHHSELVPGSLSPEYAYLCLGLFCVSDLHHTVIQYDVSSAGVVKGRVSWSVTLQWVPGGEEELFDRDLSASSNMVLDSTPLDITRDLLHPWWSDLTHVSQADQGNARPLNYFRTTSFIPLDFLADFRPSESFPRGWFCKSCGLTNMQEHFRHQICRSTVCETARGIRIPQGKVDFLSSLRDPYQCSTLTRPTDQLPPTVVPDNVTWDDDMQSWNYNVNDGVLLCHIFTGNQGHLQKDATALLERIQCEILLRKENAASPYFIHTTRVEHPSDGSGATVLGGTPHSVRTAYYTLCDFVYRYAEMDMPRFGMVRMQAWVNSGSKRGGVFRASKSPVVIHCLGVEVILKLTPKGGYKESTHTKVDKGKGKQRAEGAARPESPPLEAVAEFFRLSEHKGSGPSFISVHEAIESPIVAEHVDEAMDTMDTALQCCSSDAGSVAILHSNPPHLGSGSEGVNHEGDEPKPGHGCKKNKVTKDKNKASVPEISMTLVHGDCVVLYGDDFECQIVRVGTSILVMGFPEGT